jgi:y4mF family transcriptional regulator
MAKPFESTTDKILREAIEGQRRFASSGAVSVVDKGIQNAMMSQKLLDDALGGSTVANQLREIMEGQRGIDNPYSRTASELFKAAMGDDLMYRKPSVHGAVAQMEREVARLAASSKTEQPNQPLASSAGLASLIRKARKRMGMNQQAFADYAGVGRRFLSELENGKPSLEFDKVLACARTAGIDIIAKPRLPL